MHIKKPQVIVPDFWLSDFGKVQKYLRFNLEKGALHEVGRSTHGFPVNVVEYPNDDAVKLMVIGGTHGHEPGGVASAMNLVHLMETGSDLADKPHESLLEVLSKVHLYVVPCLNPDGRSVCPDSFYSMTTQTTQAYANGVQKDGNLIPYDAGSEEPLYYFDPEDAIFVGGQFNGAGYAINRRRSTEESDAVEPQAVLEFVKGRGLDAIMDLHACASNFAFQIRSRHHEAPYWEVMREWQRRAEKIFHPKGRQLKPLYGDGDPPDPPHDFFFNSQLFHRQAKLMWMSYEGRQGYVGHPAWTPQPTEWEIIDDYLSAITVFLELGVEGYYAKANKETFAK